MTAGLAPCAVARGTQYTGRCGRVMPGKPVRSCSPVARVLTVPGRWARGAGSTQHWDRQTEKRSQQDVGQGSSGPASAWPIPTLGCGAGVRSGRKGKCGRQGRKAEGGLVSRSLPVASRAGPALQPSQDAGEGATRPGHTRSQGHCWVTTWGPQPQVRTVAALRCPPWSLVAVTRHSLP